MTTPKIFIVRIHKSDPWDKNLNQAKNDLYVNEFDHTSSNYETCDFMDGAVKMNLEEASRCAGILNKMHQNYGAPINEQQINSLGAYLSVAYGSAKATDENIIEASKKVEEVKSNGPVNVQTLLKDNSCLSCHGLDHKVVGPGYNEVAAKYKSVLDAEKVVTENIKNGGSGRWGVIPRPPMTGLTDAEAKALAEFILSQ